MGQTPQARTHTHRRIRSLSLSHTLTLSLSLSLSHTHTHTHIYAGDSKYTLKWGQTPEALEANLVKLCVHLLPPQVPYSKIVHQEMCVCTCMYLCSHAATAGTELNTRSKCQSQNVCVRMYVFVFTCCHRRYYIQYTYKSSTKKCVYLYVCMYVFVFTCCNCRRYFIKVKFVSKKVCIYVCIYVCICVYICVIRCNRTCCIQYG